MDFLVTDKALAGLRTKYGVPDLSRPTFQHFVSALLFQRRMDREQRLWRQYLDAGAPLGVLAEDCSAWYAEDPRRVPEDWEEHIDLGNGAYLKMRHASILYHPPIQDMPAAVPMPSGRVPDNRLLPAGS